MGNPLTDQLTETVRKCVNDHFGDVEISPASIASCAFPELDPDGLSPETVKWGCLLELRGIARGVLRNEFDPIESEEPRQHPLFPDLQDRYPTKRPGGPKYVLLDHLSPEEAWYNVNRLRKEAEKKMGHADSLEEFIVDKFGMMG